MSRNVRICSDVNAFLDPSASGQLVGKELGPGHCRSRQGEGSGLALPRREQEGDTTPRLFRDAPEDTFNPVFLAMA